MMRKVIAWLLGILTSIGLGVSFIPAPEKPYDPTAYYRGQAGSGEPDYKAVYNSYNTIGATSIQDCDKGGVALPKGVLTYEPTSKYSLKWFWGISDGQPHPKYLEEYNTSTNTEGYVKTGDTYTWSLTEKNRYLVAIANSTLVSSTSSASDAYPETGQTEGVRLGIIIVIPEADKAFKVTYGTMEKWWCCMGKKIPDNEDAAKPRYGHTVTFSDEDKFYAGSVIGLAGTSGMSSPKAGTYYLSITIEQCALDDDGNPTENWSTATLEDLYPDKD